MEDMDSTGKLFFILCLMLMQCCYSTGQLIYPYLLKFMSNIDSEDILVVMAVTVATAIIMELVDMVIQDSTDMAA
jgi:hypothetical protein